MPDRETRRWKLGSQFVIRGAQCYVYRNKSENKISYDVSAFRWVREEAFFTVQANSSYEADELASAAIGMDECTWTNDPGYHPEQDSYTVEKSDVES